MTTAKKKVTLSLLMSLCMIQPVFAATHSTDGVIKGVQCHLYGKLCNDNKMDFKFRFEKDFVLVEGDQYYLLDNLPYAEKLHLNGASVRVQGETYNNIISVTQVRTLTSNGYKTVWDWDEINDELYEN